jgi:hypothetical protein
MAIRKEPERSIREVMGTSGWVRRTVEQDPKVTLMPQAWQGQSGRQVAAGILEVFKNIDFDDDSEAIARRAEVIQRCTPHLGNTTVTVAEVIVEPTEEETPGRNMQVVKLQEEILSPMVNHDVPDPNTVEVEIRRRVISGALQGDVSPNLLVQYGVGAMSVVPSRISRS